MKITLVLIAFGLCLGPCVYALGCLPDSCTPSECQTFTKQSCKSVSVREGDRCSCCWRCNVAILKPNDPCKVYQHSITSLQSVCPDGYYCDSFKGRCSILLG